MVIDHQMKEEGHDQNYYWFLTFNVYPFVFYLSFWLSRYYDLWIACLEAGLFNPHPIQKRDFN